MQTPETDAEAKPIPKTIEQLGNSIWDFYQDGHDRFDELLTAFLTAGKLELAIELLKLKQLDEISGNIDKIAVEGIPLDRDQFQGIIEAIYALQP
jgi:hypothetical protein